MPDSSRAEARVFNSLLRCTRSDDRAAGVFGRIAEVPGLWVLELGPDDDCSWPNWLSVTYDLLSHHRPLLTALGIDSSEFTLHIALDDPAAHQAVRFPDSFTALISSCGISIELFVYRG